MSEKLKQPVFRATVALFCCILWGSAFPTLKTAYRELGIGGNDMGSLITFAGCRFLLASLFLHIFGWGLNKKKPSTLRRLGRKDFFVFALIGLFQTSLQYLLFYTGLVLTPGSISSVVVSSGIFFTVILARVFFPDDRITWQKVVGILLGFTGILVVSGGVSSSDSFFSMGVILLVSATFSGSVGAIMVKKFSYNRSPLQMTAWQMFLGSILLLILGRFSPPSSSVILTPLAITLTIYSALISAVAFTLWNYLLKYNKAGEISFFKFAIPLFGTLLSILILNEPFSWFLFIPLILVSTGILLVTLNSSSHKPKL